MNTNNPIFYKNPTLLNAELHSHWSIKPVDSYEFARETNSIYLMAVEMVLAAKHYPIVFAKQGDSVAPIALLGVEDKQNNFVGKDGKWLADYIPAYVRRYPFIPALTEQREEGDDEKLVLCIDDAFEGLNREGVVEGAVQNSDELALFESDGTPAPITQQAIALLQSYHSENSRTLEFCKLLEESGLLEEAQLNIEVKSAEEGDDKQKTLNGFMRINPEKFTSLSGETLAKLRDSQALELIYAHFQSLTKIQ